MSVLIFFFKNRILRLYMRTNPHIFGYSDTCACSICIMAKPIQIVNSIKIEQGTKTLVSITFVLNFLIKFPFVRRNSDVQ